MCHYGNAWCHNQSDTSHECPPRPRAAADRPVTDEQRITEIRERRKELDRLDPLPWREDEDSDRIRDAQDRTVAAAITSAAGAFIAHAPADVDYLLARVDDLEEQLATKDKALRLVRRERNDALARLSREGQPT